VLEKLGKVDKLVVQVWRVVDALERIAGMRSKTLEDNIISWLESGGEKMETLESVRATGAQDSRRILSYITVCSYDTTHLQENPQRLE